VGFLGAFEYGIDTKGRVNVPPCFREEIRNLGEERVVITRYFIGNDTCLDVYPYSIWTELAEKFRTKARFDADIAQFRLFYCSLAHDCRIDKQGRMNIPQELREYAQLDGKVRFVSDNDKFQLWEPTTWSRIDRDVRLSLMANPAKLAAMEI